MASKRILTTSRFRFGAAEKQWSVEKELDPILAADLISEPSTSIRKA